MRVREAKEIGSNCQLDFLECSPGKYSVFLRRPHALASISIDEELGDCALPVDIGRVLGHEHASGIENRTSQQDQISGLRIREMVQDPIRYHDVEPLV